MKLLLIGVFGLIGVYSRYAMNVGITKLNLDLPIATIAINIIGSFLIGWIYIAGAKNIIPDELRIPLMTGLLGGFTTFSAFSLETINLFVNQRYVFGTLYVLGSVAGGIGGCLGGMNYAKNFLG